MHPHPSSKKPRRRQPRPNKKKKAVPATTETAPASKPLWKKFDSAGRYLSAFYGCVKIINTICTYVQAHHWFDQVLGALHAAKDWI